MTYAEVFGRALGSGHEPYQYQADLAQAETLPSTVVVPTGLGKTAALILAWLWRRFYASPDLRKSTPRRLIYCLPMRVLVEQTMASAKSWIENLELSEELKVHVLMGGEQTVDWDLDPEQPAILIGTQDMLLSRALNRGYAMSRYRWPMPFGLLNNDSLWIFDEVQLMDAGVATSAQLEALRLSSKTFGSAGSIWTSATLQESWLETVDFPKEQLGWSLKLGEKDHHNQRVERLWTAPKPLRPSDAKMGDLAACAAAITKAHIAGTKTLAVFNTVDRAVSVFRQLLKKADIPRPVLIHSRFRADDRTENLRVFLESEDIIAVTTQAVEAGVDVSATTLLTELAPWASLVQRFGRCNRKGDNEGAQVHWFDPGEIDETFELAAPYAPAELLAARPLLLLRESVSLEALNGIQASMSLKPVHVLRRRDLVDLFDTTPDLAGNDIDVSRFIRANDEHDVSVYWRKFADRPNETAPRRDELCSVAFLKLRDFHKNHRGDIWRWDGLNDEWRAVHDREIYPGQTYLVRSTAGGYDRTVGWNPENNLTETLGASNKQLDAHDRDSEDSRWLSIAEHTDDVVSQLRKIIKELPIIDPARQALEQAARWHDRGKAHETFQGAIGGENRPPGWVGKSDVGKAPGRFWRRYDRTGFRHELASALAMMQAGLPDLAVYLAAAHHGKVRLSIRSLPAERPALPGQLFARGIRDGDELPSADLGGNVAGAATPLSLECMQMGRSADGNPSWVERMLRLRDELGPFRLAYLEALLRAADIRTSKEEAGNSSVTDSV